jgi:3D-(3,5/4)-trihydroxycyclohexane-1,2-dione acylhydrolase (decyclizing)
MKTVRLTTAQALVRYLIAQRTVIDGEDAPLFPGVFAIFGHGNVTGLGFALDEVGEQLPTIRGQNEQGMALAAVAYAKAMRRRQIMVATSSIGPGATNMVTAAGVAMANRLPVLLLSGDTFQSRIPDPVLQQVEHFGAPSTTVNDAFRAVTRHWDRITHPAQIAQSLPLAVDTMLDPADCGPAFLALPQDVQAQAYDFPERLFEPRVHELRRTRPDARELEAAADALRRAERPLVIAGGGVHYSLGEDSLRAFVEAHGLPVVESVAGKSSLIADHHCYVGPIGVTGCDQANRIAADADVVLCVGTRLQDFTTGSWTVFGEGTTLIGLNAARFDAAKHRAQPLVADVRAGLEELTASLGGWRAADGWLEQARAEAEDFKRFVAETTAPGDGAPTYAQVIGAVNQLSSAGDYALTAAGGFPGELNVNWLAKGPATFDCEYGFSCMGYEISGAWGARLARRAGDVIAFVGDGSYLMMNSDLYSSVITGQKVIAVVCDNGGFAVIDRLQTNMGGRSFNNMFDNTGLERVKVDWVAHAQALGCRAEAVSSISDLREAFERARSTDRTTVIAIETAPDDWTPGGAFWEVGVAEVSDRAEIAAAHEQLLAEKQRQRVGW